MQKNIFILIIVLIFFVGLLGSINFSGNFLTGFLAGMFNIEDNNQVTILKPALIIDGNRVVLDIANNNKERARGLSGRESLSRDNGMLFVFSMPDNYGFWMKDMNFAIDIAWLDENFRIVHIEKNATPDSYPKVFKPADASLYVLEVVSNFFEESEIKVGDTLVFENLSL